MFNLSGFSTVFKSFEISFACLLEEDSPACLGDNVTVQVCQSSSDADQATKENLKHALDPTQQASFSAEIRKTCEDH